MRAWSLLLALAVAVAGCASDNGSGAPPEPSGVSAGTDIGTALNNTTAPALPVTLELQGCLQMHTFFSYPIALFENLGFVLPDGFTYDTSNGQTVDAFLAWWFCPAGLLNNSLNAPFEDVGSMFASLPVVPPSSLTAADANPVPVQLDLVPLVWIIDAQLAADHLGLIDGLRDGYVEHGEVELTGSGSTPATAQQGAYATPSFGTFLLDSVVQLQAGDNPEGRYRMWLAPEGTAIGYLDITNGPGAAIGSGVADLRFVGDAEAGAPPATGGMAHAVDATDVRVVHVPLGETA